MFWNVFFEDYLQTWRVHFERQLSYHTLQEIQGLACFNAWILVGKSHYALLTMLYRSTDCLSCRGAPVKNLAHNASFHSMVKIVPSNAGTEQLGSRYAAQTEKDSKHLFRLKRSSLYCTSVSIDAFACLGIKQLHFVAGNCELDQIAAFDIFPIRNSNAESSTCKYAV
jgi:hypothetical protein